MRIYRSVVSPAEYEWVTPIDDADFDRLAVHSAYPLAGNWTPIEVELVREDEGVHMMKADFPWLGEHTLVMRGSAAAVVAPLVRGCAELLPLHAADADLQLLHVTDVRDALDEGRSELVRYSTGRVMTVRHYVFDPTALVGARCFRIPQLPAGPLFLTRDLVDRINDAGLTGFSTELAWED